MKVKFLPMFAGVIATAAVAATSLPAFAQAPPAPAPASTQNRPRIVFTQEQQAKFEDIKTKTVTEIESVLNGDQKKQFATGRENGEGLGAVKDLSEPQKTKIMGILQAFNSKIGDILTAEQKQQIEQSQPRPSAQPSPQTQPKR
jgi:hypothetical protein